MTSPQKGRTYEKDHYSPEEIRALLAQIRTGSPTGVRNRALITLLWQSGLRVSEALALRPHDIDSRNLDVFVRHGKGNKPRHVSIAPSTVAELDAWFAARERLEIDPKSPLFCTLQGGTMKTSYVRDMLKRYAAKAGWSKRAHPHGLRHSYAIGLVRRNVSPEMIRRQLGHSSLVTTTIYLQSLTSEDIAEVMKDITWD